MKIIVAPDSFKGSLTATEAAVSIEKGLRKAWGGEALEIVKIPVADGGEGTVEALLEATKGSRRESLVHGPLMEMQRATWGIVNSKKEEAFFLSLSKGIVIGIIEMASVAGLTLLPEEKRNPIETTTYGVGELIIEAISEGCEKIIIGLGGSGTNDGGIGMAQALGVKFYLEDHELLQLGAGAKNMSKIKHIDISDIDTRIASTEFLVACDVTNPMAGLNGATKVYGPQKGGSKEQLDFLEKGMEKYADVLKATFKKDIGEFPGSGAAGGLGGGLLAFLKADLRPGIEIVMELSNFKEHLKTANLLIVGEGRTDEQTSFGKAPAGLAREAAKAKVPVVCLSGSLGKGYEKLYSMGMDYIVSCIEEPMELEYAMLHGKELLENSAFGLGKFVSCFRARQS